MRSESIDVVIGIGGDSALEAAKAIAGLLKPGNSVMDHLEGAGPELPYLGPTTPFIAIPTTAGTGSEATKNAVLSVQGVEGFKKSFRDEQLVAEVALIDPDLLATCPPAVIAANGMDAFTQLLESYVSSRAAPLTDSLARGGLKSARDGLLALYANTGDAMARERMTYAAMVSGITLAQVGLGSVHGLAAPLGAFFPIPHGVACGTLVATATRINIEALRSREPGHPALEKYAQVGRLLSKQGNLDSAAAHAALIGTLEGWTKALSLPSMAHYGRHQPTSRASWPTAGEAVCKPIRSGLRMKILRLFFPLAFKRLELKLTAYAPLLLRLNFLERINVRSPYFFIVLAIPAVFGVFVFNQLVTLKHNAGKAWSNIDILLKQRHDELPKLV